MVARLPGLHSGHRLQPPRGFAGNVGTLYSTALRPTAKNRRSRQYPAAHLPPPGWTISRSFAAACPASTCKGRASSPILCAVATRAANRPHTAEHADRRRRMRCRGGQLEYHGRHGEVSYEASLTRLTNQWDDSPGNGYRVLTSPGGAPQYDAAKSYGIMQLWPRGMAGSSAAQAAKWNITMPPCRPPIIATGIAYVGCWRLAFRLHLTRKARFRILAVTGRSCWARSYLEVGSCSCWSC